MKVKVIGCGGAGFNIANLYEKLGSFNNGEISCIGLDTSEANISEDTKIEYMLVPGVNGSGSERGLNKDKYVPFCESMLSQNEAAELYVIVYSGGGGTGSSLGPILHRTLMKRNIPVISIVIGDQRSIKLGTNTVSALVNLSDFANTGIPPIFSYYENNNEVKQSEIDKDICGYIDLVYVMFGTKNKRIDNADIQHFFNYSKVTRATPIISELKFLTEKTIENYDSNPVACISMFANEDRIVSPFSSVLYEKAGIFSDEVNNEGFPIIHAVLDHGVAFKAITKMLDQQKQLNAKTNTEYQTDSKLEEKAIVKDDNGFLDLDI